MKTKTNQSQAAEKQAFETRQTLNIADLAKAFDAQAKEREDSIRMQAGEYGMTPDQLTFPIGLHDGGDLYSYLHITPVERTEFDLPADGKSDVKILTLNSSHRLNRYELSSLSWSVLNKAIRSEMFKNAKVKLISVNDGVFYDEVTSPFPSIKATGVFSRSLLASAVERASALGHERFQNGKYKFMCSWEVKKLLDENPVDGVEAVTDTQPIRLLFCRYGYRFLQPEVRDKKTNSAYPNKKWMDGKYEMGMLVGSGGYRLLEHTDLESGITPCIVHHDGLKNSYVTRIVMHLKNLKNPQAIPVFYRR